MSSIIWKNLAGQERVKEFLDSAFQKGTLGHAFLFCGERGTGKFAAGIDLVMSLLCTSSENRPCWECESCRKIRNYAHPDFHALMPVVLQKEHRSDGKLSDAGWQHISKSVKDRVDNPYAPRDSSGIPSIPLEWLKEINHAVMRGPLEGDRNAVIIDGVDLMKKESANAMLKTLEEPPAGSTLILMTERIHAVLPTIISRCQIVRFSFLPPEIIRSELISRYGIDSDDPRLETVIYTGSIGEAINLWENPQDEITAEAMEFWKYCCAQDWNSVARMIDRIDQADNFGNCEGMFLQLMNHIRSSFFRKLNGTENYIMSRGIPALDLKNADTPEGMEKLVLECEKALGQIRVRVSVSLVLVNFAISVMEILNGKKQ